MGVRGQAAHWLEDATASDDSGWIPISGYKKVILVMKRESGSSGSTSFSADIAPEKDGTGAVDYAKWIDNTTNTNVQQLTRVSSKTLSTNTTAMMSMSPEDIGGYIQISSSDSSDNGTLNSWLILAR